MKVLGVGDERTTCEHCGRTDLKRTVAIQMDDGSIVYYGTTCATNAFRGIRADLKVAVTKYERRSEAKAFIYRSLTAGYSPDKVAIGARNRFGDVAYRDERFFLDGQILIYLPRSK